MPATQAVTLGTTSATAATSTAAVGDVTGQPLTIEFWLKAGTQTGNKTVLLKGDGATHGYLVWLTADFRLRLYVTNGSGQFEGTTATTAATDDAWHHWAVVKSPSPNGITWYRDGVANGFAGIFGTTVLPTSPGAFQVGGGIVGSVSEVRLWSVARTQAQVVVKKDAQLSGAETGLVGYWPCTEGAGTTVGSLPAGKSLTLSGAGWSSSDVPAVGTSALSYAARVAQDSPLGYWRLGEASGPTAADGSGNGRHGTYTGGVTLGTPGAVAGGTAATFNGTTGYVALGTAGLVTGNNPYAIEAWCKTTDSGNRGIFGYGNFSVTAQSNALRVNGPTSLMHYWWGRDMTITLPSGTVNDGAFHHAVVTWDGTTRRAYWDGAFVSSDTPAAPNFVAANARIGSTNSAEYWNGVLGEVAVYGSALAALRVGIHYESATESGAAAPAQARRWTGSAWTAAAVQRWTGSAHQAATVKRWDGTGWV